MEEKWKTKEKQVESVEEVVRKELPLGEMSAYERAFSVSPIRLPGRRDQEAEG